MKIIELIAIQFVFNAVRIDAAQGSNNVLLSTISLIGIGVFTIFIGALLFYACKVDIKHWRKSIDGRAQLKYPNASLAEYQLTPIQRTPETPDPHLDSGMTKRAELTQHERTPEEKKLRIVTAMYAASNREIPQSVQESLKSRNGNPLVIQNNVTTLHTISEKEDEHEFVQNSTKL